MSAFERLGITECTTKQDYTKEQGQTRDTFKFLWENREGYDSPAVRDFAKNWLIERYCGNEYERLAEWLSDGSKIILDAGCGAGLSAAAFFADHLKNNDYLGVDISDAVYVARQRFQELGYPGDFLKSSLLDLPIPDRSLDMIFSEGVLHHTDSTENSLKYLATKLKSGGRFLFYVYIKKAFIREVTDDHIRNYLQSMTDEEAWRALMPLTRFGASLGKLNMEIEVPEDIPALGIAKGKMNLQRFFYWNIFKAFYREDWTEEEMNQCNFDWFRPLNCHRHTPEEITKWIDESGLVLEHMDIQEAGITVVAVKS